MRPKTRSAMAAGQISRGCHHAVEAEGDRRGAGAHVEMDITGPGALGLRDETLQDLRRGLLGVRSLPARHGAMFSHNVSGRDHGIVNGVEQPEYFRRTAALLPGGPVMIVLSS